VEKKSVQINFRGTPLTKRLPRMLANLEGKSEGQYLIDVIVRENKRELNGIASKEALTRSAKLHGQTLEEYLATPVRSTSIPAEFYMGAGI